MFFGIFNRANSNEVPRCPPFPMDYSIVANILHNFDRKTFQSWRNHNQPGPCSVLSHQEHSWSDLVRLEYKDTSTQKHKYTNTTWCREDWVTWGHRRSHWPGCIHGGTGQRSPFNKCFMIPWFWQHTASVPKMVFNTTPSPGLLSMSCQTSFWSPLPPPWDRRTSAVNEHQPWLPSRRPCKLRALNNIHHPNQFKASASSPLVVFPFLAALALSNSILGWQGCRLLEFPENVRLVYARISRKCWNCRATRHTWR